MKKFVFIVLSLCLFQNAFAHMRDSITLHNNSGLNMQVTYCADDKCKHVRTEVIRSRKHFEIDFFPNAHRYVQINKISMYVKDENNDDVYFEKKFEKNDLCYIDIPSSNKKPVSVALNLKYNNKVISCERG